jgi:hypothetical protein
VSTQHLVIAGTGRTGTSFLVQFLDACGFETALEESEWHTRARAGGESILDPDADLPYVVKDPWLWTYCRSVDLERLTIDALLVPMRDLMDAAASRVLQERVALADTPWVDRAVSGSTPGGVVYSLSIVDQARILAVGFHELLRWAVSNDIRTVLLDFPRIVEDGEYLVSSLWPVLDGRVDRDAALAAFGQVADPAAVRLHSEVGEAGGSAADAELDRAALAIRIGELRDEAAGTRERLAAVEAELANTTAQRMASEAELTEARAALNAISDELAALRATRSWRLTRPLRSIRRRF